MISLLTILATMSGGALLNWAWPILICLGIICILWAILRRFPLPSPFNIIVYVLAGLVAAYFLLSIGPPPH